MKTEFMRMITTSFFILLFGICSSAMAAQKVCYLTMTGGGWTGIPLAYKSCAACESVKHKILTYARSRNNPAKGLCKAGILQN